MQPDITASLLRLADLQPRLQEDLVDVVLGSILLTLGLAAFGLGTFRARSTSRPLHYLGIATALYGLRLMVDTDILGDLAGIPDLSTAYLRAFITYILPLPAILFVEWALGSGWRSSIRAARVLQIVYATGAILTDCVRGPGTAMRINNFVVLTGLGILLLNGILYLAKRPGSLRSAVRTGVGKVVMTGAAVFLVLVLNENLVEAGLVPWGVSPEPLGILALVLALIYSFAHRVFANERRLAALSQELDTARRIQSSILPRKMPETHGIALAARYLPMADVGGDFYDFVVVDPARLGILVADVSGHGVPAALIASMVKVALAAQAELAADPAAILAGMNQILLGHLERAFVTAAYIYIDTVAETAAYASAGHPPLLVWRQAERQAEELRQESLPLGRFRRAEYRNQELRVFAGDRLLLYTDGVTEARSPAGELFGDERLRDHLGSSAGAPDLFADALLARLSEWSARPPEDPLDDDVTLVVAEVQARQGSGEGPEGYNPAHGHRDSHRTAREEGSGGGPRDLVRHSRPAVLPAGGRAGHPV